MKNTVEYYTQKNMMIAMIILLIIEVSDLNNYIRYVSLGLYLIINMLCFLYSARSKPIGKKEIIQGFLIICITIVGFIYIACKLTQV